MNLPALIQSLQEANRRIDELQDTIHHWKVKYDQLYHQHMKLQQQRWCPTCQERYEKENDIELCLSCSHGIQKREPRSSAFHSRIMPTHHYHIYSGGAIGIDEYAEQCAKECNMHMHVIVPPHHGRSKFITPLRPEDLDEAEPHLKEVAQRTGKHLFTPNTFSRHLQLRNYHIVKPATALYAFGYFQNLTATCSIPLQSDTVKGGTGWTVELAINQHKPVYFYNIPKKQWYQYKDSHCYWDGHQWLSDKGFLPMQGSPTLHKHSAVVGSRHPTTETLAEVQRLFQITCSLENNLDNHRKLYYLLPEHGD